MDEKIDNGKILECRRFPVHSRDNLTSVMGRTHSELKCLCIDFITHISLHGSKFIKERLQAYEELEWRGEARKISETGKLQLINQDVSEGELKKIIRATYIDGFPPKITLHGFEFALVSDKKNNGSA